MNRTYSIETSNVKTIVPSYQEEMCSGEESIDGNLMETGTYYYSQQTRGRLSWYGIWETSSLFLYTYSRKVLALYLNIWDNSILISDHIAGDRDDIRCSSFTIAKQGPPLIVRRDTVYNLRRKLIFVNVEPQHQLESEFCIHIYDDILVLYSLNDIENVSRIFDYVGANSNVRFFFFF